MVWANAFLALGSAMQCVSFSVIIKRKKQKISCQMQELLSKTLKKKDKSLATKCNCAKKGFGCQRQLRIDLFS